MRAGLQEPPARVTEPRQPRARQRPRSPTSSTAFVISSTNKRNAVSALDNVLPDARGQRLVAGDAVDHGGDFALPKPIEGECGDIRSSNPRRLKLWPVRYDQQHA